MQCVHCADGRSVAPHHCPPTTNPALLRDVRMTRWRIERPYHAHLEGLWWRGEGGLFTLRPCRVLLTQGVFLTSIESADEVRLLRHPARCTSFAVRLSVPLSQSSPLSASLHAFTCCRFRLLITEAGGKTTQGMQQALVLTWRGLASPRMRCTQRTPLAHTPLPLPYPHTPAPLPLTGHGTALGRQVLSRRA